ncbi:MAG: hypothetical protein MHPSP_000401, partial [Paramarteilia canceri]
MVNVWSQATAGLGARNTSLTSSSNIFTTSKINGIYSECIKLCTDNKISSKNAFELHLIDCMPKITETNEEENFQVASSALDASTVIWSKRVDILHSQTNDLCGKISVRDIDTDQGTGNDVGSENMSTIKPEIKVKKRKNVKTIDLSIAEQRLKRRNELLASNFTGNCCVNIKSSNDSLTSTCEIGQNLNHNVGIYLTQNPPSDTNESMPVEKLNKYSPSEYEALFIALDNIIDEQKCIGVLTPLSNFCYTSDFNIEERIMHTSLSQLSVSQRVDDYSQLAHNIDDIASDFSENIELDQQEINQQKIHKNINALVEII